MADNMARQTNVLLRPSDPVFFSFVSWRAAANLALAGLVALALMPAVAIAQNGASRSPPTVQAKSGSAAVQAVSVKARSFVIPFAVHDNDPPVVEVLLYLSSDRGHSWMLHSRQNPDAGQFPYQCTADGQYWFAIRTTDRDGKTLPNVPLRAELIIDVDTQPPVLDFNATIDAAGRIVGQWRVRDAHIDPASLVIEYSTQPTSNVWATVPLAATTTEMPPVWEDKIAWWPTGAGGTIHVRAAISDRAGNRTERETQVQLGQLAQRFGQSPRASDPPAAPARGPARQASAPPGGPSSSPPTAPQLPEPFGSTPAQAVGYQQPGGASADQNAAGAGEATNPSSRQPNASDRRPSAKRGAGGDRSAAPSQTWASEPASGAGDRTVESNSWQPRSSTAGSQPAHNPSADNGDDPNVMIATGSTISSPPSSGASGASADGGAAAVPSMAAQPAGWTTEPRGSASNASVPAAPAFGDTSEVSRFINTSRFQLAYEIDSASPSGVKDVELWATIDGGRTWQRWASDGDRQSPFPVTADRDGVFGFRIVIYTNDGLRGRQPRPGEGADMWVAVDTMAPRVSLTAAPYGTGANAGQLMVHWDASDEHFGPRPITLSYATTPAGPWTTIAEGLRNEGQFAWKPGSEVPPSVYLRVAATDRAGNVAADQTAQPVDLSGLVPKGRIRGIEPASDPAQPTAIEARSAPAR